MGEGSHGRARRPWRSYAGAAFVWLIFLSLGNKKPPGHSAQEVAGERDVAFAVR
jgi:hypothetical protein